ESWRDRDHRGARYFDGTAGSRVRAQSLACDHRAWTLRRESVRVVLLSRSAGWLTFSRNRHQRFSRRGLKSKSIGDAIRMRLKSACSGFSRKFLSAGVTALGTARTADRRPIIQTSPLSRVFIGGGGDRPN